MMTMMVLGRQWHQLDHMQTNAPRSRQINTSTPHHSIFTGRMLFLTPNEQCQSTEGNMYDINKRYISARTCSHYILQHM